MPDSLEKLEADLRTEWVTGAARGHGELDAVRELGKATADRLRALRERDEKRWESVSAVTQEWDSPDDAPPIVLRFGPLIGKLDAALAEMERDQPFIDAAEALGKELATWGMIAGPPGTERFMAAYRARREGGKHGDL